MLRFGLREWNYEAIELTLKGLNIMNYKVATVLELIKFKNE